MFLKDYIRSRQGYFKPLVVSIICIYAFYLRIVKLAGHKLWADELFQLSLMNGSFIDLLKILPRWEYCSYLSGDFYLIFPFFKMFSYNRWGLAIPHIIITIVGFYFLYLICKLYFKTIWGYIITFTIVCFNTTLINHATEIRTYAVLPTLALGCLYLFLRLVNLNFDLSLKKKWAIGIFFVATIWFHIYGIVIIFCSLFFALISKIKDKNFRFIFKRIARYMLVVFLIAMPLWLFSVLGPHAGYNKDEDTPFAYISNPLDSAVEFSKAIFGNLIGHKKLYFLLIGFIFPFILSYKQRLQQITFLIVAVFIPIGLIFVADLINEYWFVQRQFIWVIPSFAFFLGWSWESFICQIKQNITKYADRFLHKI